MALVLIRTTKNSPPMQEKKKSQNGGRGIPTSLRISKWGLSYEGERFAKAGKEVLIETSLVLQVGSG